MATPEEARGTTRARQHLDTPRQPSRPAEGLQKGAVLEPLPVPVLPAPSPVPQVGGVPACLGGKASWQVDARAMSGGTVRLIRPTTRTDASHPLISVLPSPEDTPRTPASPRPCSSCHSGTACTACNVCNACNLSCLGWSKPRRPMTPCCGGWQGGRQGGSSQARRLRKVATMQYRARARASSPGQGGCLERTASRRSFSLAQARGPGDAHPASLCPCTQ